MIQRLPQRLTIASSWDESAFLNESLELMIQWQIHCHLSPPTAVKLCIW